MKYKKIISITMLLTAVTALISGCGTTSVDSAPMPEQTQILDEQPATTQDSKENWPEKITIVQMPNDNNPNVGTIHKDFCDDLSEYLGIEVTEMEGTDYTVGVEAMASGNIDVMLVTAMSYYQAKERANAELLVSTPMAGEYRSVIITRADSGINSLEDLKGHSFAFVDQASSSGYMYPKALLINELDLDTDLLENSDYFFSTVAFSGAHDTGVMGVYMGDYDAVAVAGSTMESLHDAGVIDQNELKQIAQTDLIPNPAYVIRGDLPDDLKQAIKTFYLEYDDETYFEEIHLDSSIRFVDITEDDYKIIYDTLKALKIEE